MQMFDSDLLYRYNQIYAYFSSQDNIQYDLPAMIGGRLDPFDSFAPNLSPMSDSLILYCKLNVTFISKSSIRTVDSKPQDNLAFASYTPHIC